MKVKVVNWRCISHQRNKDLLVTAPRNLWEKKKPEGNGGKNKGPRIEAFNCMKHFRVNSLSFT